MDTFDIQAGDSLKLGTYTLLDTLPPIISIDSTFTKSIFDSVILTVTAFDPFYTVSKIEWDIDGASNVFDFKEEDTAIAVYNSADIYYPVVRVTDCNGNSAYDTTIVTVLNDPPIAILSAPERIFKTDPCTLSAANSYDLFGTIKKYEWDFGNTGTFFQTTGTDTVINITEPGLECVLRVTDDDGQKGLDTGYIHYNIFEELTDSTAFSKRYFAIAFIHDSLLWLTGGAWKAGYELDDMYYTADGINWTQTVKDIGCREVHTAASFKDKIWVISESVYCSDDGITWEIAVDSMPATSFAPTKCASAVFNDKLWVMGGYKNEVWSTSDGYTWIESTKLPTDYDYSSGAAVVDGYLYYFPSSEKFCVRTTNGSSWEQIHYSGSEFATDMRIQVAYYNGNFWAAGYTSVWRSKDARNWTVVTRKSAFPHKQFPTLITYDNKLFIMAGWNYEDQGCHNNVWVYSE